MPRMAFLPKLLFTLLAGLMTAGGWVAIGVALGPAVDPAVEMTAANQLMADGNFAEAAQKYRAVAGEPAASSEQVADAMQKLWQCRQHLQQESEIDADLALALQQHPDDYRVLDTAARLLLQSNHYGVVANGQFTRGFSRGYGGLGGVAGTVVHVLEQDRLQALQWRQQAIELAEATADNAVAVSEMMLAQAEALLTGRSGMQAWNLQSLTDLSDQPNYLDLSGDTSLPSRYAPVQADGNPVVYPLPESWDQADSDGGRMRWALSQAEKVDALRMQAKMRWADFLDSQFSVETLQQQPWLFRSNTDGNQTEEDAQDGVFSIHTLEEDETIAKLASGVRRFHLADDANPIRIYQQIAESDVADLNATALWKLAQIFLNRRQYTQAAERLESYLTRFGDVGGREVRNLLNEIREPRFSYDPIRTQTAGKNAEFSLLFRNAEELQFTARRVDIEKILRDTKEFYRGWNPQNNRQQFGGRVNEPVPMLSSPSSLFDQQEVDQYLLEQVANWRLDVTPRANHWDRRIVVETPINEAGLYLIEAVAGAGGQRSRCLMWVQDTALVQKPMNGKWLLHVADAITGQPIEGANIELFGFGYERNRNTPRRRMLTSNFAVRSNAQGLAEADIKPEYQWFSVARTNTGRLALLDFENFWRQEVVAQDYRALKAYGVSDRPMYRPGETLKAKFWLAYTVYGDVEAPSAAGAQVRVALRDPQGIQIAEKVLAADKFGGIDMEFELQSDAALGRYYFDVALARPEQTNRRRRLPAADPFQGIGVLTSLAVRVEEYRKPEFEVQVLAPEKPVALGETVQARIEAKYYFGAPVTDAEVNVKVERRLFSETYYPPAPYDWCYGPGYWWFAKDYTWYPGWEKWHGCVMPTPEGWPTPWRRFEPPELVLEQELNLDSTGHATIAIDTAIAKAIYGDENHVYSISVEVRDASRRTITAQGSVIAARQAFNIYSWTDRGYYRVGDRVQANFQARMLDGTPVTGSGTIDVLRIRYDEQLKPQEQVVASFAATTDEDGRCRQLLSADQSGQYRVRLRMADPAGHEIEGAYIFNVRGAGSQGGDFRYTNLELIPDRAHYGPGDVVQLQIAANRADALVAVFVRPQNGAYERPQWVRLQEKSAILEIPVTAADQPNFFVEAYTIYDGQVHHEMREIIVPPADRVLNVELVTDKHEYLPGEQAEVTVSATDAAGKPVSGSCVIAAYDRSLEQIASDVLPQDIREFFWKWQRSLVPQQRVSLNAVQHGIALPGLPYLRPLGIFGQSLADDLDTMDREENITQPRSGFLQYGAGGGGMGGAMMMDAVAEGAAPMMSKAMAAPAGMGGEGNPQPASVGVRKDFADSALWLANLTTDASGKATAKFKMPDNLTSWQVRAWSVDEQIQVGSATVQAVTRKPLLVRLQTPRFLVERDEVVVSAIVHNDLPGDRTVNVALEIDGETQLELIAATDRQRVVTIKSHEQARIDWRCRAVAEGKAVVRVSAITEDAADAMQLELPIVVNGMMKMQSLAGTIRDGQDRAVVALDIPEDRRVSQSSLTVQVSPSLAASMIDALPFMLEYPYGCTEQTLNRFLPTVITQRVLQEMQVDLAQIKQHRNNLNTQELGDPAERRARWQRFSREAVFDEEVVADMVASGVRRLSEMQNGDGGWGWFSGPQEHSAPHTTATVVRGLLIAQQNNVPIVPDVLQRGVDWLQQYQQTQLQELQNVETEERPRKAHVDNLDALVFHVLVLADRRDPAMQQFLYDQREHLSTYGKALVAWATHQLGNAEQTAMLRRNIEQFLVEDPENETAFIRDQAPWWYWYGSEIEANALYLKLLAAVDPRGQVAPRVVKYLLNNRKHATYWDSTRDTALAVEAFADFIRASGELSNEVRAEVWLAGKRLGSVEFTPQNMFAVNNTIHIYGAAVPAGTPQLEIRRSGGGNLYWNAYASNFTLEDEITPAGLEVKVERRYYQLHPETESLTLPGKNANPVATQRGTLRRTPLDDLQDVPSGTLVEVELLVQSKNDYEYLLIEDYKPAGLETVETQSGYFYQAGLSIYRELRDQHVGLCVRWLPRGNYSIRYQLRSEAPGTFTALPTIIQGMYAPELRGNSSDFDLSVVEEE